MIFVILAFTIQCRLTTSSTTAAGNVRSAETVADKLPEPSDCKAGRRLDAATWLGSVMVLVCISEPLQPQRLQCLQECLRTDCDNPGAQLTSSRLTKSEHACSGQATREQTSDAAKERGTCHLAACGSAPEDRRGEQQKLLRQQGGRANHRQLLARLRPAR